MSVHTTGGMSRRRGTATGLFLVAALVAASCASDDDSSAETVSGDAETPVTTEAAESETETEPSETAETDESESTEGGLWTAAEALGVVKGDGTGDEFVPQRDMEEVEGEYAAWMRAVETVIGMK